MQTKHKRKRLVLVTLITVMLCNLFLPIVVQAANSYYINGVYVKYTDFSSEPSQCWEYANKLYNKIWGHRFTNKFDDSENSLRNLSDSELTLTKEHLKEYVSNAELGSVLRICDKQYLHANDGWGHSQIIVQKDANGFTVLQGGLSAYPYKNERYYTWDQYMNTSWLAKYDYIKYIKWPGAPAYEETDEDENKPEVTDPTIAGYVDVHESDWFSTEVAYVKEKGLMTGMNETEFGPYYSLARAQFAVILYRMSGSPEVEYENRFPDVPDGIWYTDAIIWANNIGVISGYENGYCGTGDPITREQMASMMYRYAGYMGYDTTVSADITAFEDDETVSGYAREAMCWVVGAGIITGKNDETLLDPLGKASRAECAIILTRFMEYYGIE